MKNLQNCLASPFQAGCCFFQKARACRCATAAKELGEKLVGLVSWWQASTGKGDSCGCCELWFDCGFPAAPCGSAKIRPPKRERQLGGLGGVSAVTFTWRMRFQDFFKWFGSARFISAMYSRPFGRGSHSPILRGRKRSPWWKNHLVGWGDPPSSTQPLLGHPWDFR